MGCMSWSGSSVVAEQLVISAQNTGVSAPRLMVSTEPVMQELTASHSNEGNPLQLEQRIHTLAENDIAN